MTFKGKKHGEEAEVEETRRNTSLPSSGRAKSLKEDRHSIMWFHFIISISCPTKYPVYIVLSRVSVLNPSENGNGPSDWL